MVDYVTPTQRNIGNAVALLTQTQLALVEDLKDIDLEPTPSLPAISVPVAQELSSRVFVVHGHDEGTRETVARFLMQLGFEPIILHEQANQGAPVMEKVEAHGQVGFAVVLLTPDDDGFAKGGTPEPRAGQRVVRVGLFEYPESSVEILF